MQFLGLMNIKNTLKYIHLEQALFQDANEDFICKVAKTLKEARELFEAGFEYVTDMDSCKLFRKRKTSLVRSSAIRKGSSASLALDPAGEISCKPLFFLFEEFSSRISFLKLSLEVRRSQMRRISLAFSKNLSALLITSLAPSSENMRP